MSRTMRTWKRSTTHLSSMSNDLRSLSALHVDCVSSACCFKLQCMRALYSAALLLGRFRKEKRNFDTELSAKKIRYYLHIWTRTRRTKYSGPIMRHAWSVSPIRDTLPWLTPDNYFPVRFSKKPIGRDYRMAGRFLLHTHSVYPLHWSYHDCTVSVICVPWR